jgi:hypothetical protein
VYTLSPDENSWGLLWTLASHKGSRNNRIFTTNKRKKTKAEEYRIPSEKILQPARWQ